MSETSETITTQKNKTIKVDRGIRVTVEIGGSVLIEFASGYRGRRLDCDVTLSSEQFRKIAKIQANY